MKIIRKFALLGAVTAFAGLPWVTGAPVVPLYPQDVVGTLSVRDAAGTAVPFTSFTIEAMPEASSWWSNEMSSASYPSLTGQPYAWSLTLDGGHPEQQPSGRRYKLGFSGTHNQTPSQHASMQYRTEAGFTVVTGTPPPAQALTLANLRKVAASITVTHGTLQSFQVSTSIVPTGAHYQAHASRSFNVTDSITTASQDLFALPQDNVWVQGHANVLDSSGRTSQRYLAGSSLNLTNADGVLAWTIDATPLSGLQGMVSVHSGSSGVTAASHNVVLWGLSPSNTGVSAWIPVRDGQYSMRGPEGDYEAYVYSNFSPPSSHHYGEPVTVNVPANTVVPKDFSSSLNTISMPLAIGGFYTNATVSSASGLLARMRSSGSQLDHWAWAGTNQLTNGELLFPVSDAIWKPHSYSASVNRPSSSSRVTKTVFADPTLPQVNLLSSSYIYPSQQLTLVESKVYLDVIEPQEDDPQVSLRNPSARAFRENYGPSSEVVSSVEATGNSSGNPDSLVSVTLVAEPGDYTLSSKAYVGNTQVSFPASTILFGRPVSTPPGTPTAVWTPDDQQDVQVSLDFNRSTAGGTSSVVKTTQGPTPPEGFSTLCSPNQDDPDSCPTIYYDIRTNIPPAVPAVPVEVCIRQAYQAILDFNGSGSNVDEVASVMSSLSLFHFKEGTSCDVRLPPQDELSCWERLTGDPSGGLPSGKPLVANCATDLADCGCDSALECGISSDVTVLQSCGLTSSFSPFAVLRETGAHFSNTGVGAVGTLSNWVVPTAGVYKISAVGAQGGAATGSPSLSGGCGAEIDGELSLAAGDTLRILVGQKGLATELSGGGGGGSFVVRNDAPLVIAGGGGGVRHASLVNGRDASLTNNGIAGSTSPGYTSGFVPGGTAGRGGSRVSGYGAGGGGWSGNGAADGTNGEGGSSFLSANVGRGGRGLKCDGPLFYAHGGYGGGGAGNGCHGAGGGGGYSGGGGGRIGGGGGSWNSGANPHSGVECTSDGHGRVVLKLLRP